MILLPAIDIRGGLCVRLTQGDYAREKVYGSDPLEQLRAWGKAGASWVHVVDLDGAKSGMSPSRTIIKTMATEPILSLQTGGGIRSLDDVKELLGSGVTRVVLGTWAAKDPKGAGEAAKKFPSQVWLGLDIAGGKIRVAGWTQDAERALPEALKQAEEQGFAGIIATDIGRDGMLGGPDPQFYQDIQAMTRLPVIASGGVGSLNDIRALAKLSLWGVIVGKALYEKAFSLPEALVAAKG